MTNEDIEALVKRRGVDRKALAVDLLDAIYNGDVSAPARVLFCKLLVTSYANRSPGELAMSISTASDHLNMSTSTYNQTMRKLRNAGWVETERRLSEGGLDLPSIMRLVGSAGQLCE